MIKVKKPQLLENKFHLEQEEKPIVEATTMTSEDVHGGDEITRSVDDQRFAQQQASEEQNEENTKEQEEEIQEQGEQNEGQEQNEEESEEEGEENEEETKEQTGEQTEENDSEEQSEQEGQENENDDDDDDDDTEQGEQKGAQNENIEQEEESEEENEEKEHEEQTKENKEKNSEQAFELSKKGKIFLELYKLVEYLSDEEKMLTPEPVSQTQSLNVKKLLFRQYERKPISAYYYYKERSETILILDNSGSMSWLQTELDTFFNAALKRKDIQVFLAPNGIIEEEYNTKTKKFQEIEHERAMRTIVQSGLPVLYVGDFDGGDTPVELSWTNKIFWICTENRYKYFSEHDWMHYTENEYKGFFGRAWNFSEIVHILQEFAKHIMEPRFWLDLHKDEDFEEEE